MSEIDRDGIHAVMSDALARVTDGTDCLHVSFDLDAVDPTLAPGVGTPVKGGLDYREAHLIMEMLAESKEEQGPPPNITRRIDRRRLERWREESRKASREFKRGLR